MAQVFVIPDVHLKPKMFDEAEKFINQGSYDYVVCLGDLVDDWGQGENLDLYAETLERCKNFAMEHENALFCYGNHDISYLWGKRESGYSEMARPVVLEKYGEFREYMGERLKFVHKIDNVIFSHAGITEDFVQMWFEPIRQDVDAVIHKINTTCNELELWQNNSPLWERLEYSFTDMYQKDLLQVVGHTPTDSVFKIGNVLSVDTFSTYRDGSPIGNQRFIWVDTKTMKWEYAE